MSYTVVENGRTQRICDACFSSDHNACALIDCDCDCNYEEDEDADTMQDVGL